MKPNEIKNITDLVETLQFNTLEELKHHLSTEVYPVTIEGNEEALTLRTDADRVPFTKVLRYPFSESDFDNALTGLQCVTDYAMHEGYDNTHKDLFESIALRYAEKIGVYEYKVNGSLMEYWSLYEDGFHFIRVDLNTLIREKVGFIPWTKYEDYPVPAFLRTSEGYAKYNHCCG